MKVPEGYVAFVEELPGANTQGDTIEEARENLKEAVALVMEANRALSEQAIAGAEVIRGPMRADAGRTIPSQSRTQGTAQTFSL